jgi:uroporphyrinogen decarboxylase
MNSLERVLTTLGHKEPDRVPLFLLTTMHGARELGMSIKEYFSRSENVIKGQEILLKKYGGDNLYPFFYAALETEAWGGDVVYRKDGPPNSGDPLVEEIEDVIALEPPVVQDCEVLLKVVETEKALSRKYEGEVPLVGVVISPFSVPVMQLGFSMYLDILNFREDIFKDLMNKNIQFSTEWANYQLENGATAICYFDPVSSTTIIPREMYVNKGMKVAAEAISKIKGPTATHFASGRCYSIVDDVATTGTAAIGVSEEEDISVLKEKARGKLSIIGNLNGIQMRRWTDEQVDIIIRELIEKAAPGGGFILSDNHGEIPFQVPDNVLHSVSRAVRKWGEYPIEKED